MIEPRFGNSPRRVRTCHRLSENRAASEMENRKLVPAERNISNHASQSIESIRKKYAPDTRWEKAKPAGNESCRLVQSHSSANISGHIKVLTMQNGRLALLKTPLGHDLEWKLALL